MAQLIAYDVAVTTPHKVTDNAGCHYGLLNEIDDWNQYTVNPLYNHTLGIQKYVIVEKCDSYRGQIYYNW